MKIKGWHVAVVVVLILGAWAVSGYNGLVRLDVAVDGAWSQVETQYQRRADLIPNLQATVEGAADFEKSTFTEVTEARTKWLNSSSADRATQIEAANNFDSALSRLLVTVEAYPQLKANENFLTLQSQLEGTENRVAVVRKDFNDAVMVFNGKVRVFPTNLLAGLFGFTAQDFFQAKEGSDVAPKIDFSQ